MKAVISFEHKGNFNNTFKYFKKIGEKRSYDFLNKYGERGVQALSSVTPKDTGLTAASWTYTVEKTKNRVVISWNNTNVQNGINIAVILQ